MKITLKKEYGQLIPYSKEDKEKIDKFQDGAVYELDIKNMDIRTIKQNASIHKWCKMIAEHLNKQGYVIQDVIKLNTKWDMLKVKEMIFKPVVKSLYTKDSTTKLNKNEFELIIDTIILALSNKGIDNIPDFPHKD
jgi:hypothetical protein